MTYKEFCNEIAPSILELQDECSKIDSAEFETYRKVVMEEIGKVDITRDFMNGVFDMIYRNLFQTA